ncbi:DnaA regulatory inactivator Hda [Accumulibacter sp.]|uniref:DnaA regulatory inactivator Hda n=1 Tax=Accumulibacter sp. TaxID=2053492 RepID=UPI0025FB8C7F|nr:DnaA regulatory inactivator Hda [Accumulibacter sp.]MCM8593981.1 DnaA regulatory inactivator Hda [Accumulibacter sp.]MCM8624798.1 DnaA regulatory inactivator Hda [Accumulibacter sp.]MDS4048124.1 DnaA regulatory inactivator Hda [Accumulibacter sp.]
MRQLILDLLPEEVPSFDSFVTGRNGETLTAFAAWLSADNQEPLFFLWGEPGAGKSHLLRACGARYHDAIETPGLTDRDEEPMAGELLAIDHLEALDEDGQIALFRLINALPAQHGRLLVAAGRPPLHLALREDLRTRLGSGLVYRLQPLTDAEQRTALAERARARGLVLPAEAIQYLFSRAPRDMRSLTALLGALDRLSLERQRPITVSLVREVLQTSLDF